MPSVPNLRDLGGYRTATGEWVRMGLLYRSNALTLSAADKTTADSLGLRYVYDLRTAAEAGQAPDVVPAGATRELHDVMGAGVQGPAPTTPLQAADTMRAMERVFVDDPASRAEFGAVLADLATRDGAQLFHCTGGKDRTGWAAAVVLTLLGVDQDAVMQDYQLSDRYVLESPGTQAYLPAGSA
ncbi:tyrosine-protein phosphatase [Amycolatopsis silviterrae]|uniref:Tyrosine-protein phosphatase n=1 Tax=Amycolatopsis silviterrae TaxID=1656914 RepID=A0ABW5H816_9PSEU